MRPASISAIKGSCVRTVIRAQGNVQLMGHPYFGHGRPFLFGHRGASGERPENTVPAFERALAQGAMAIETDVHATRDGEVVVFHDADLSRTTNEQGPLSERSLAEIQQLDAGFGFSPDGGKTFPFRGTGIRIPRLDEVFQHFPNVPFNIEIKAEDPQLVSAVLDQLAHRPDLTLVAAAEDTTMAMLREQLARRDFEPAMGASVGDVLCFVQAAIDGTAPPPEPMVLQVPPTFGGQPLVTPELITYAHAHQVDVHVWTINDVDEMKRLLALGVDGLMSDFPGQLVEIASRG